jgi:Uma2 family endonuclease
MSRLTRYRMSASKYEQICATGVFEDEKVELLDGILIKMTTNPEHNNAVTLLARALRKLVDEDRWTVCEEKPVRLGRLWRPEPDVAIVRGPQSDYVHRLPGRMNIALIAEVADSTYAKDTGIKLIRYERCGLPTYWVVDLNRRRVEVREMGSHGLSIPIYYSEHENAPVVLDGKEYGRIRVADLLP